MPDIKVFPLSVNLNFYAGVVSHGAVVQIYKHLFKIYILQCFLYLNPNIEYINRYDHLLMSSQRDLMQLK